MLQFSLFRDNQAKVEICGEVISKNTATTRIGICAGLTTSVLSVLIPAVTHTTPNPTIVYQLGTVGLSWLIYELTWLIRYGVEKFQNSNHESLGHLKGSKTTIFAINEVDFEQIQPNEQSELTKTTLTPL